MRILLVNKYLYRRGGAEVSTLETGRLLLEHGHDVCFWGMHHPSNPSYLNQEMFVSHIEFNAPMTALEKIKAAGRILYSFEAKRKMTQQLALFKPDIVHLNNIAHQLSPSIIDACLNSGVPVVMTARDLKLVCPNYQMYVHDDICFRCKDRKFYNCMFHKCMKNSRFKSVLAGLEMYLHHRILNIYGAVASVIAPSRFMAETLKYMGFKGSVHLLPNFVDIVAWPPEYTANSNTIVYFGRMSPEKGIITLIDAVAGLDLKLHLIGDGPSKEQLQKHVADKSMKNVLFFNSMNQERLSSHIRQCLAVVLASRCLENNPRTVLEGFACGKPAIGSRIGGIPELIEDQVTGWTFTPGSSDDLRNKLEQLISSPSNTALLGRNARSYLEHFHSPQYHYAKLIEIYNQAINSKKSMNTQPKPVVVEDQR